MSASGSGRVDEALALIRSRTPLSPQMAVVLGSGLGAFARTLSRTVRIPFGQIPHLRPTSVAGHAGELVLGQLGDVPLAVFSGRLHLYEGLTAEEVVFPVRIAARLGARVLVVTNAAGRVNGN